MFCVFVCVCVSELLGKEEYWPILLSTVCIPAIMQLLTLPWFPESPRYLLIDRGDDGACQQGTACFYNYVAQLFKKNDLL